MRNTGILCALMLLSAAFAFGQGEVPPSIDSGPLTIRPESPPSDQPAMPKPDREGIYSVSPEMTLPRVLKAMPAVDSDDVPDCEPRAVTVSAVIGVDGRASVREFLSPRSSLCANPAVLAIKGSQFQPAKLNHLPVPVRVCLRVPFEAGQPPVPGIVRCPARHDPDRQDETDSLPIEARPAQQRVAAPSTAAPMNAEPAAPVPDEQGAYSLGPGIVSPRLKTKGEVSAADAAACKYPTVVSAVINADGTIKVGGVYEFNHPDDKVCDDLAIAAIEKSTAQPATLNGVAVPARVCMGIPFGRPAPPVVRGTLCPRGAGAVPMEDSDAAPPGNGVSPPAEIAGVKPPSVISQPSAEYSREARKKQVEGKVMLSLVVTREGLPTDIQVINGLGYGLDEKAVDAARQYRFQPATKDGKPVAVQIKIEVNFRLRKD